MTTTRAETVVVTVPAGLGAGDHPPLSAAGNRPWRPGRGRWSTRLRRGPSARLQIMGWLVLLLAIALLSVILVTRNLLNNALEDETIAELRQEVQEFEQFAREGRNPETGQPFLTADQLLQVHLERQRTGESEVLAGISATPAAAPLLQGQGDVVRAIVEPGLLDTIAAAPATSGTLGTQLGELRWVRVPIQLGEAVDGHFVVGYFVDLERTEVDLAVRTLTVVSALGLALAAGASWIIAGQILGPVRVLHRTAAAISEDDLTQRIPVHGRDDISALAEQFNAMLDRLQAAFATQRGFLDDAGHELRTPITIVRGTLELLGADPVGRAKDLRLCLDELDRMGRIVDDLLLLAKSERPDFVRPEPVEIAELTSDIDAKIRTLGDRRWMLASVGDGVVHVDPQRLTQAVVALAHNAVQHTAPADPITVGSALHDGRLSFWITDCGPGVSAQDAHTIFDRFSRGSADGARANSTGAGLGLAIVTAIAVAHGGEAKLVSTFGKGATFGIDIPARTTDTPERQSR